MNTRYWTAIVLAAASFGSIGWVLLDPDAPFELAAVAAAALPIAVLIAVWGRLGGDLRISAAVWGAVIGAVVATLGLAVVMGIFYFLIDGFAESAEELLDAARIDPALTEVLGSRWFAVFAISLVVVGPIVEEIGKAAGGLVSKPEGRSQAFLAGAAAGTGFAVIEDLLYALGGSFFDDPAAIVLLRSLGAAVHPLASGLVVLGWWEWRHGGEYTSAVRGFVGGVGVHALWNASVVALVVTEIAYATDATSDRLAAIALAYSAAIGAVVAAGLWRASGSVADGGDPLASLEFDDAWSIAGWTVLTASFLIPVVMLVLAFPGFS